MQFLSLNEKEELIDISTNSKLRSKFKEIELAEFLHFLSNEFPEILLLAFKVLLRFPRTYFCEKTFSLFAENEC